MQRDGYLPWHVNNAFAGGSCGSRSGSTWLWGQPAKANAQELRRVFP
jgi:hypothetical protein